MIRYENVSPGEVMSPGRSGLISFSSTVSDCTASSPSRRKSALKPISSGSPVYGAGSDSRVSPTSWLCAETVSSPSAKRRRSGRVPLRHHGGAANDVEHLGARQRQLDLVGLRDQLLVVRELAVDPAGRQPHVADTEDDVVVVDAEPHRLGAAGEPRHLGQRPGRDDRLELRARASRAPSPSPRAGTSRSPPSRGVCPSKRTRMPVSTGRDSSREADRDTRSIVCTNDGRLDLVQRRRRPSAAAGSPRRRRR